ncbi:cytochrome p450 [Fagus crenata]
MCFGDALGPLKRLAFWLYGRQAMDLTMRYDEILERKLKQREESGKRDENYKDLMDILLKVYQDDKAEVKITRIHIKALLLDLFAGGTGTAAEAMQWTIAELMNNPEVFNKVREEIKSVVGTRLVEESDIPSLPYLRAVVKETPRLYPPGPIAPRECRQSCKIKGFDVPQKTMVIVNLYAIMRDPDLWDNPNEFRPERNQILVLFGGGRKSCPGSMLALSMMHCTIASMVQCFDWNLGGAKISMQVGGGFSLPMAHPLICLPVVHFNPFASSR